MSFTPQELLNEAAESVGQKFIPLMLRDEDEPEIERKVRDIRDNGLVLDRDVRHSASALAEAMRARLRATDETLVVTSMQRILSLITVINTRSLSPSGLSGVLERVLARFIPRHVWDFGRARLDQYIRDYHMVQQEMARLQDELNERRIDLLSSILTLDRLRILTESQLRTLEICIAAGERVQQSPDGVKHQHRELPRHLHDLRLTRMVVLFSLPQVNLTLDSCRRLIEQIENINTVTIPAWKQQIDTAIHQANIGLSADAIAGANDRLAVSLNDAVDYSITTRQNRRLAEERMMVQEQTILTLDGEIRG